MDITNLSIQDTNYLQHCTLNINSMFSSISGETGLFPQGTFVDIIRLQGCNLQCAYCDAQESIPLNIGKSIGILDITKFITNKNVLITGGEPLIQSKPLYILLNLLQTYGTVVQIETNGTILPSKELWGLVDSWVFDWKLNSRVKNIFENIDELVYFFGRSSSRIHVKFVVSSLRECHDAFCKALFIESRMKREFYYESGWSDIHYALSPLQPELPYKDVLHFIQEYAPFMILNVQLHKILSRIESIDIK